jgi:hypothetical protein
MGTIRNIPVESSTPPFKAMLPFDHRILRLENEPFLPTCYPDSDSSESDSDSSSVPVADALYGELAIYDSTGTTLINLLDWGDVLINAESYKTCLLKNIGTGPLTITALSSTGGFLIDPLISMPIVLAPGATRSVRLGINIVS